MGSFGLPEILLVLLIVILIFGVGRVGQVGRELGTAIREFRRGLKGDDEEKKETKKTDDEAKS
jgi:sec-independent protein translocase protein TatA